MRLKGEGSIFCGKDGYWRVAVSIDGKQRTRSFGKGDAGKAAALAAQEGMKAEAKAAQGKSHQLFAHYLAEYMTQTVHKGVRDNTYIDYVSLIKTHINDAIGSTPISEITTKQLQEFYDNLKDKGLSGSRINKVHTLVGQALRAAIPDGMIDRDPTAGTRRISTKPKNKKILFSDEQAEKFLSVVDKSTSYYKNILLVHWEVGGRISEILGLRWEYVGKDYIDIQSVQMKTKKGVKDSPPKTEASRRRVFLTPYTINIIESRPKTGEYVFTNENGKPINERNWRRQWDQWLVTAFGGEESKKRNGDVSKYKKPIVKVTPHSLRHLSARNLLRQGWSVADVQKRGGWESAKVLQDIYAAHSEESRQRDMAKSASIFAPKDKKPSLRKTKSTKIKNLLQKLLQNRKPSPTEAEKS